MQKEPYMKHSVSDLVVNQFSRSLKALRGLLKKSQEYAQQRKFDENLFLQMRFAPDMFPFVKQVQITSDIAKAAAARLSGQTPPSFPDDEKTLADLISRIDKTLDFIQGFKEQSFHGYEQKQVSFPWYPGKYLTGDDYLSSHAIPNFYFHMTTAYDLLRQAGMPIGKGDFLGEQNWRPV
jgi:uncharacterized protein